MGMNPEPDKAEADDVEVLKRIERHLLNLKIAGIKDIKKASLIPV